MIELPLPLMPGPLEKDMTDLAMRVLSQLLTNKLAPRPQGECAHSLCLNAIVASAGR